MTAEDADAKVWFELAPEDGWPPAGSESLWARAIASDLYELRNVPWFARGYAFGDVVRTVPGQDVEPIVVERVEWSGRYTVRVIPLNDLPDSDAVADVVRQFSALGAECESALPAHRVVALDIPPTAEVARIKDLLIEGEVDGRWGYDEGLIDDLWREL
jgi:hypothetical protein